MRFFVEKITNFYKYKVRTFDNCSRKYLIFLYVMVMVLLNGSISAFYQEFYGKETRLISVGIFFFVNLILRLNSTTQKFDDLSL